MAEAAAGNVDARRATPRLNRSIGSHWLQLRHIHPAALPPRLDETPSPSTGLSVLRTRHRKPAALTFTDQDAALDP